LSTAEEQDRDLEDEISILNQVQIAELLATLWRRRLWLAKAIGLGMFVTLCVSFLIPNEYTSTAQLMPPDPQMVSSPSMLGVLTGSGINLPSFGTSLMSQRTPGSISIGILSSRTVQDDIIDRFDLRRVYRCKYYVDARKDLTKYTAFDEDRKSGIVSITVTDRDPHRARDIAGAYVEELDKLVNTLSTSSARREREFLETRIQSIKTDLDEKSHALSEFSSRNATMDPQKQGEATVAAATRLQSELITAESELSGMRAMYADSNVQVREVRARIAELQSQLQKMGGGGKNEEPTDVKDDDLLPSVRELPLLGFTYYDLYRQVTIDETLYETLTKQYELAKVQEAKDIPPVKVLDAPDVPERHSFPHRSIFLLAAAILSGIFGVVWIIVYRLWEIADDSSPIKSAGIAIRQSLRGH
jgi:capsule polysaccharide export protein KpsE/RkpR